DLEAERERAHEEMESLKSAQLEHEAKVHEQERERETKYTAELEARLASERAAMHEASLALVDRERQEYSKRHDAATAQYQSQLKALTATHTAGITMCIY
ncbi:hypothetical protein KIPB_015196, partial [Kipferlia bialata]